MIKLILNCDCPFYKFIGRISQFITKFINLYKVILPSVLVSATLIWLRNVVALWLVLHGLTHMNLLLLMSSHGVMMVHHAIQMIMRTSTWVSHQRWRWVWMLIAGVSMWLTPSRSFKELLMVIWLWLIAVLPLSVWRLMHLTAASVLGHWVWLLLLVSW